MYKADGNQNMEINTKFVICYTALNQVNLVFETRQSCIFVISRMIQIVNLCFKIYSKSLLNITSFRLLFYLFLHFSAMYNVYQIITLTNLFSKYL